MSATRKVLIAVSAAILFDLLVFRSGLYASVMTTDSMQGRGVAVMHALEKEPEAPGRDILITGDSRAAEGFSVRAANAVLEPGQLAALNAAVPGSDLRDWYYFLQAVDPHCDRYRAIVLTLPTFRAAPPVITQLDELYHADFMEPVLGSRAYWNFARSELSWRDRFDALEQWIVDPLTYQADFGDLLGSPRDRWRNFRWKRQVGMHFADDYTGRPETMAGLSLNPATGDITYPARLSDEQRHKLDIDFKHPNLALRAAAASWQNEWLTRMAQRYAGSKTRIYVARVPSSPLPEAVRDTGYPLLPFFQDQALPANVVIVPESLLLGLERPEFFFDNRHLNAEGRKRMTRQLSTYLEADLQKNDSRQAVGATHAD